jgi:hypothetical protein
MLDPAPDRDVIHSQAALRYDFLQIAVAQWIPQVPPHAENDDYIGEVSGPAHDFNLPEAQELFATHPMLELVPSRYELALRLSTSKQQSRSLLNQFLAETTSLRKLWSIAR